MISSLKAAMPRFHENLKYVVLPFIVDEVDGKFASFVIPNNSGFCVADTVGSPGGLPHSARGHVDIVDGLANVVLRLSDALIQLEEGEAVPSWPGKVLGSVSITGIDQFGRVWVGQSHGVAAGDETSIDFEMATSSETSVLKAFSELDKHFNS